ncbi:MAG: sulfatase-like hydrolase/transferase [Myxococcota bacterium]
MQSWLVLMIAAGCSRPEAPPPNVLLVTLDTTRADRIGAYGFPLAQTPTLDRLAKEGALFERHTTTAPITLPAHISILTGLLPPTHGVRDNGAYALSRDVVTLPEHLAAHGYETRAWVSAAVLDGRYDLDQGFMSYDDDLSSQDTPPMFLIRERPGHQTATEVVRFIEERDSEAPFFAWMHLFDPHLPWQPDPRTRPLAPTGYDAEIATADLALGRVIEALRRTNTLHDTLVVVTADHGEGLGEHGERTHAVFIYDSTMHVPLVVRHPATIPPGTRIETPTSAVDLVPTILATLDLPPLDTQGLDLNPLIAGGSFPPRDLYMESLLSERGFGMAPLHGLRRGDQVWIRAPRAERYNTTADPRQHHNLHPDAPVPGSELDAALTKVIARAEARSVAAVENPMSTETKDMLMALGYLTEDHDRRGVAGLDPKDGLPLHNLLEDARHAVRRHELEAAEGHLKALLDQVPEHVSALNVYALVRLHQERYDDAEAFYRESLRIDAQQYRVLQALARLAARRNDPSAARALLHQALAVTPDYVEGMVLLGVLAFKEGNRAEAERWHQKALAVDPTSPRMWRALADLRYREGRWTDARGLYERVTTANPKDFEAWLHTGVSALRMHDHGKAREATHRAQTLRPDSWLPAYNLACIEAMAGRAEEALQHLDLATQHGLRQPRQLTEDPDLATLRGRPDFNALLARMTTPQAPR